MEIGRRTLFYAIRVRCWTDEKMTDVLPAELMKQVRRVRDCLDCGVRWCDNHSHTITVQEMLPVSAVTDIGDKLKAKLCLSADSASLFSWRLCGVKGAKRCSNCKAIEEVLGGKP